MKFMFDKLEEKWGKFEEKNKCLFNRPLTFLSLDNHLNHIFKGIDNHFFEEYFMKVFGVLPPSQLLEFYSQYNGCRLFFDSLSIYGVQGLPYNGVVPFDLAIENINHGFGLDNPEYIIFGGLGGNHLFAFKSNGDDKVYRKRVNEAKALEAKINSFNSEDELIDFINNAREKYKIMMQPILKKVTKKKGKK